MRIAASADDGRWAKSSAETDQMIYRPPVRYEDWDLAMPVLIAVGAEDRTVVMKDYGDPARTAGMGNFPVMARAACADVRDCPVAVIENSGRVPHLGQPAASLPALNTFLK